MKHRRIRLVGRPLCGLLVLLSLVTVEGARSPREPLVHPQVQPRFTGSGAWAELDRRGEKDRLLSALEVVRGGPTYLKAEPNPGTPNWFGWSVSVSGDTAVVGALIENGGGTGVNPVGNHTKLQRSFSGAAYVFVLGPTGWSQQAYLKASNPGEDDTFGTSVAVSGDTIVVGADGEDGSGAGVNPASDELCDRAGAAYVFVRVGTTWTQQAYLKASNPGEVDTFGMSVDVDGDTVVVGARGESGDGTGVNPPVNDNALASGAAYVFVRTGTTWSHPTYLKASNTGTFDLFGYNVAVSGETIIVGASNEDGDGIGVNPSSNDLRPASGAAYVFVRSGGVWSQQAYLKASNPGTSDYFGSSVDLDGDTAVVGALFEDGSGTGVNPPSNEAALDSGAAYVFQRSGGTWSLTAYLKAMNPDAEDYFGRSVAVSGRTIVVGAVAECGSGIGVNPADDDLFLNAGAAYVFVRRTTTWAAGAYLKASNTYYHAAFGVSVAVSGNTIVAGASGDNGGGSGVNPTPDHGAPGSGAAYVYAVTASPIVDLNGDGRGDVLTYNSSSGDWAFQVSQSEGGFAIEGQGTWAPGWSILPAHFNHDGLTDFFLFNEASGNWAKVLNTGTGFTAQAAGQWWPGWKRYVMNLDADDVSDLFLYDPEAGTWFKCLSTESGFTYLQGGWSPGWEIHPMALNGDTFGDLFLINRTSGRWFWVLGQKGAAFSYPVSETWFPGLNLHPGDFNADGLTDILLHDVATGTYSVATNAGAGFTYRQGGWSPGRMPYVADLNADHREDVFLYDALTGMWLETLSDGAGGFTNAGEQTWSPGWMLFPTDLNADERADILLYNPSTGAWNQAQSHANGFTYSSGTWAAGLTIVTRTPS